MVWAFSHADPVPGFTAGVMSVIIAVTLLLVVVRRSQAAEVTKPEWVGLRLSPRIEAPARPR